MTKTLKMGNIVEFLYDLSLDTSNLDAEYGDVDGPGWFGFINFDYETALEVKQYVEGGETVYTPMASVAPADKVDFVGWWGACIEVDVYGRKSIELYETDAPYFSTIESVRSYMETYGTVDGI